MAKIYGASKLKHAQFWLDLRGPQSFEWTARWPNIVGKWDDSPAKASVFWKVDCEDVLRADCVLVYAEPGDRLRGAIFEAGLAIGAGKPVWLVGENDDYGTWQYTQGVYRVQDITTALKQINYVFDRHDFE